MGCDGDQGREHVRVAAGARVGREDMVAEVGRV